MERNRVAIAMVSLVLLFLGVMGVLSCANATSVYLGLIDEEHMTDSGIAYRDLENATYTYDRNYLEEQIDNVRVLTVLSAVPLMVGLGIFYAMMAMPNGKDDHRRFCDGTSEKKYCPECGLKLSRLEKD